MRLRVFISSPGDVGEERRLAGRVLDRLALEFQGRVRLEPLFWEHEPLRATATFQEEISLPSESDVVVVILWSRLGTRLPPHIVREDGTRYGSGTEFEFEDAAQSFRAKGVPDLLVYRKTARPVTPLDSEAAILGRLGQKKALDAFVERWFRGADGSFQAAFHAFETPADFEEQLENHVRRLVERRLATAGSGRGAPAEAPLWTRGSPFRGLETFEFEHATVFCGRTRASSDILDRLRRQAADERAFVLVLGMSGCGKSSLVRAGVLPQLTQPGVIEGIGLWRRAVARPGDGPDPFRALAAALLDEDALPELAAGTDAETLAGDLREAPRGVVAAIRQALAQAAASVQTEEELERPPEARLALLVDQFEELFTLEGVSAKEREAYVAALDALARSGRVWVLATLRSDFYDRCAETPVLLALKEDAGQYDLLPPAPAEIAQMIRLPSRMAGLSFEEDPETDAALDDVLRDAAAKDPAALPLLEFALDALYVHKTDDGVLTFAAYRELGGLEGAIARRAEETFGALAPEVQAAAPRVFEALVRFGLDDRDHPVKRRASLDVAGATPEARALVDAFVAARLFAADRAPDGTPEVSLAHEALLGHWPRLGDWVGANRERLRARARIGAAAAIWQEEGEEPEHLVTRGHLLEEGRRLLADGVGLAHGEARFLEASLAAARRERRRRHAAVGATVVLLLLLAAGAWFYYDANLREHVAYYAGAVPRWGVLEPRGEPLGAEALAHSFRALRVRTRGGRVLDYAIVRGNGELLTEHEGGSLIGQWDPNAGNRRECIWEYRYFEDGSVSDEIALNQYGQTVHHLRYPQDHRGKTTIIAQYVSEGLPSAQSPSGAAFVEITRDDRGYRSRVRYMDHERRMLPNATGSYGEIWETDGEGRVTSATNLGPDGSPHADRRGVTRTRFELDGRGRAVRMVLQDGDGNAVLGPDGYASLASKYDAWGNLVETACRDGEGRAVRSRFGWASVRKVYDDHGNQITESYFCPSGLPMTPDWGPATVTMKHDDRGEVVEWACFDGDGKPMPGGGGFVASVTRVERDRWGNPTRLWNLGVDGSPAVHPDGNSGYRAVFDDVGNRVEVRFLDGEGRPVAIQGGYAGERMRYDEKGRTMEVTTLGVDGKPVRSDAGYAIQRDAYDHRGNLVRITYHQADGTPARHVDGNAGLEASYDAYGNRTLERYLDLDGKPMELEGGYAARRMGYDERNRRIQDTTLDLGGRPVAAFGGYATTTTVYDERNDPVRTAYLDEAGAPTTAAEGVAGYESRYDEHGRRLERSAFGVEGSPTVDIHGVATTKSAYDDRGDEIRRRYFGLAGEPTVRGESGDAGWNAAYDDDRNQVLVTTVDRNGEPAPVKQGYASIRRRFDGSRRVLEETYLDVDGEPTFQAGGYATVRYERDARGLASREAWFGPGGEPVVTRKGSAVVVTTWDADGSVLERTFLGPDGKPLAQADGWAGWRATWDAEGRLVEKTWRDGSGGPVLDGTGGAGLRRAYDEQGHVVEETFLDLQGHPKATAGGYAIRRDAYDEHGHRTERDFFDADGRPVLLADGTHGLRWTYDPRGREVLETHVGLEGQPRWTDEGFASQATHYDEEGRPKKAVYLDPEGKPTLSSYGYSGYESHYDLYDRLDGFTTSGVDGRPVTSPLRYATRRWVYDAWGNTVREAYQDVEGRPAWSAQGMAVVASDFDRCGREIRRSRLGTNGEPVVAEGGWAVVERTFDACGRAVEERWRDADGRPTAGPAGAPVVRRVFDSRGLAVREEFFGGDGAPVLGARGWHRRVLRYDAAGRAIEERFYDADERPATVDGRAGVRRVRDAWGRVLRTENLGPDGKPTAEGLGFAAVVDRYDDRGRLVERHLEDAEGALVVRATGEVAVRFACDDLGREIRRTIVGAEGAPVVGDAGWAVRENLLDAWGRVVETRHLDAAGALTRPADGFPVVRHEYDTGGRETRTSYWEKDDVPATDAAGVHAIARSFDGVGNLLRETTLGPDDRPVVDRSKGWAEERLAYGPRYNRTEDRAFDEDGNPVRPPGRGATVTSRYDERDRQVEVAHYDVGGAPLGVEALGGAYRLQVSYDHDSEVVFLRWTLPDGTSRTRRFDDHQRLVERAFEDAKGRPDDTALGFARQVWVYDDAGGLREMHFEDAVGKPVSPDLDLVVVDVVAGSEASRVGIRAGDVIVTYDGHPVSDEVSLGDLVRAPGSSPRPVEIRRGDKTLTLEVAPGPMGVLLELHRPKSE